MLGGAESPGGAELLTVTVARDEHGYGMKVSGDNPVYVQSVKEHGAAWRAGLRAGDRILRVDNQLVAHHSHQHVVQMIRANPTTVLTVQQHASRLKTPITSPVPANLEKQRQFEASKVKTMRLMLDKEQKYIRDLRSELLKVPDVRKSAELDSAEQRCSTLQREIDVMMGTAQMDNRNSVPVLHMRSRSSPEQLDNEMSKSFSSIPSPLCHSHSGRAEPRDTPPPGTPPPPYHTNTQPCADPQRAIISMEEDDSPASDTSTYSGLFSNLRSVRESKARTAVLLNWLLGERRCACACLLLVLTDGYRSSAVPIATLRRWAYEIHSAFLIPNAVLQLSGVDENMANEIEHVLVNEYEKEELLRNVFRKARQKAKDELGAQLREFQVKRQVGLASLYGPGDSVIDACHVDKIQEQAVVERLLCGRLQQLAGGGGGCAGGGGGGGGGAGGGGGGAGGGQHAHHTLLAALAAAALCLQCRPAAVASALGSQRAFFLQRDKLYKQRVKQINKQHQQPFVVRGHHLQLQALTSVAHCHRCDLVIWGLAPQAYFCTDCKLRVHQGCARGVEEACCIDAEPHNNRISRFMERIHTNQLNSQDSADKKSKKASGATNFLNMERSFRKAEEEQPWEPTLTPTIERRDESDESLYESADGHSDVISASDDALPRLGKTLTISKESLKIAVTDEEADVKFRKGHRKAMSLSNPIEMVKSLGDEWLLPHKKELEKNSDRKKSRESLWSEEDRESINDSSTLLDQNRKNSRKEDKSQSNSRKSSNTDAPKTRKTSKSSSVSALNFLRRKKTPTSTKPVEVVPEDKLTFKEILNYTTLFLDGEKRFSAVENRPPIKPLTETDSDEEPTPKQIEQQHRRRLSRQASRSKSKARGKSQSLKVNTLRKSHSGTLKKNKKKGTKGTPSMGRSRQTSIVDTPSMGRSRQTSIVDTPIVKKKHSQSMKQSSWLFSSSKGETRREGSSEEPAAPDADVDTSDATAKDCDKDNSLAGGATGPGAGAAGAARGVSRAESCRERDAPRRGKHRNASDPNRLTAHNNNDLEPGSGKAPSGSSSSSSLSSRSNESNTVAAEHHASQSDVSDEEEPLAAQWSDSIAPHVLSSICLSARLRKRQEVIHELIVSEGSHVRWLKVLGSVFLRPLEAAPALLPPDELRALLPNLPAVRERHARLYAELRALRARRDRPLVDVGAVASAMLNTLGEPGYLGTLARFCRGQRMALEALRERRRKHKELHQFLCAREQLPRCARLQLRDLLACVWQRLTKYQLLLESVLKTVEEGGEGGEGEVGEGGEGEGAEGAARLRRALQVAKDVLHGVDTAVRTAENEHRLRSIQSKLEVRPPAGGGAEWDELRRLDLTARALTLEGELAVRNDSNKKIQVTALMLEDALVLAQREGERFVLKPIPQPSPQQNLSPLVKWDKVLFRPNAAVRNTFFLMNINGVQMHELSANSASEYATWVRHIQAAPLAQPALRPPAGPPAPPAGPPAPPAPPAGTPAPPGGPPTPAHAADRSNDDSGINVSRNPSDASEKSNCTADDESERETARAHECERDAASAERDSVEREKDDKEEKQEVRQSTVGRISTHVACPGADVAPCAVARLVCPEPADARAALSPQERLRRLDEHISRCLRAKARCVAGMLGVPPGHYRQLAELAVADALGHADLAGEMRARGLPTEDAPGLQTILLAAMTQANELTLLVRNALSVTDTAAMAARARPPGPAGGLPGCPPGPPGAPGGPAARAGRCGSCRRGREATQPVSEPAQTDLDAELEQLGDEELLGLDESDLDDEDRECVPRALLGARLVEATGALRATLAAALGALPAALPAAPRAALRDQNDALRARLRNYELQLAEEIPFPKTDPSIQEQPSNGG